MQSATRGLLAVAILAAVAMTLVEATYYCKAPPSVANGRYYSARGSGYTHYKVGTVIKYLCNSGYRLRGGYSQRTCYYSSSTRTYKWTGYAPSCISYYHDPDDDDDSSSNNNGGGGAYVYCSSLSSISNGYVTYYSRRPSSIAKYSCRSGYTLDGNAYRKCLSSGHWSGSEPQCKRNECPNLDNPANGMVKFTEGRGVGAEVWYICNAGYRLVGSESRRCGSDLHWSGDAPKCVALGCGKPDGPNNGRVSYRYTTVGAQAWYYCNSGYTLAGAQSRTCKSNGKWEPELPTCKRPECDKLVAPENGAVTYSSLSIGSYAHYSCNDGYYIVGATSRKCEASGWTDKAPICKPIDCGPLPAPDDGSVRITSTRVGATATYQCNVGFTLEGQTTRTCLNTGKWSGEAPTCKRQVRCSDLANPSNGQVNQQGNKPGDRASYTCNSGYELVGLSSRICQNNGQWSGDAPTCEIRCPELPNPSNGQVNQRGNRPGDRASYTCNSGYELIGQSTRTCQNNGQWSRDAPTCEIRCPDLPNPSNGGVNQRGNRPGDRAIYTCNSGYELVGQSTRICQNNGQWLGDAPTCEVRCPSLPDPSNGRVNQRGNNPGDRATYTCNSGYELQGGSTRICQNNGQWSGEAPTCEREVRCPTLPDPSNGRVDQQGNRPGARATYVCNSGYELVGLSPRICQNNGQWSGDAPSCEIRCPNLPDPSNGRVNQRGNKPGDRATYTCNRGYELQGGSTRICQNNGQWSGEAPICEREVRCPTLSDPSNGRVDQQGNRPGARATYVCNSGYELIGLSSRNCQNNGQWSGDAPTCEVRCPDLPNPSNGRVDQEGNKPRDRATYICNSGYELVGQSTRTCQTSGQWSGDAPTCEIRCPNLPNPQNGLVNQRGNEPGDRASYTCNSGYELIGQSTRTCQNNGKWSGDAPSCEIRCPDLPNPSNGKVDQHSSRPGARATYVCNSGYELVGLSSRICQNNGQWSGDAPVCEIRCSNLPDPSNGRVNQRGNNPGDRATYICNSGYELQGGSTRICQNNGQWSGEAPTCEREVRCSTLSDPSNGRVDQQGNRPGARAVYACNSGYELVGQTIRACQNNGQWSGDAPTCEIRCPSLSSPQNGQVDQQGNKPGDRASYTCNSGYELVGQSSRTCQNNGQWSGNAPTCEIRCSNLPNPSNGKVDQRGNRPGDRARYTCNSGYELVGQSTRTCQNNGQWSGDAPTCEIRCPSLPDPSNGRVNQRGNKPGDRATYSCNSGYELFGQSTRICQTNGQWSGDAPVCEREVVCPTLSNPQNGQVNQRGNKPGDRASYTCNSGYELVGQSTRICQNNGQWSGDAPTCDIRCPNLQNPQNGQVRQRGNKPGDRATYTCNSGYELVGQSTRICQTNGQWSPKEPTCKHLVECSTLSDPSSGRVSQQGNRPGDRASYTCNSGYELVGQSTRTCQNNGQWSGDAPTCQIRCPKLPNPTNGRVDQRGSRPGDRALYTCSIGYELVGLSSRTCQNNGQWSGEAPTCEIRCPNLPNPLNGQVNQRGNEPGDRATYTCNSGYELDDDDESTRICQNNGQWSGEAPTCERRVQCPTLSDPSNGRVDQRGNRPGDRATYTCNSGYELLGQSTRTCQNNGQWSGSAPTCQILCPTLSNPSNGRVDQRSSRPGARALYTCNSGYELVGLSSRTCQNNGQWSGEAPTCEIRCANLPTPQNGRVDQRGNKPGDIATYICNSGYELVGQSTRTCQTSGQWSGDAPTCKRLVLCPNLPNPSFGRVEQQGNRPGDRASYTCNSGYELVGQSTRTCQNNGQWSGDAPTCERRCPTLPNPSNGRVDQRSNRPGATALYTCNIGYELVGQSSRTCQNNGQWSGEAPTCEIQCSTLPDPSNGRVNQQGNRPGDRASYTCNSGYELVGQSTRTCQNNGEWSGDAPTCTQIVCPNLSNPPNGRVSLSTGVFIGSRATYTCDSGYSLVGVSTRVCQNDGTWSGRAPICRIIRCGGLNSPSNGLVTIINDTPGGTAVYTCNSGYTLVGRDTRTCQDDGSWSGIPPICRRVRCADLPDITNGEVSFSSSINFPGSTATYTCTVGYTLVGNATRTCLESGEWSGVEPLCTVVECGNLANPRNGRVDLTGTFFGSVATYSCNRDYTLEGPQTRRCQADGTWSGREPTCEREVFDCGNLEDPENGSVDLSDGTTEGSSATYTCFAGYQLKGVATRTCTRSGWSDKEPTCEPVNCGALDSPDFGQVSWTSTIFSGVATYSCFPGYVLIGQIERRCEGNGIWSGQAPSCEPVECDQLANPDNGFVIIQSTMFQAIATYSCNPGYELIGSSQRTCLGEGVWSGRAPICQRVVQCPVLTSPTNGQVTVPSRTVGSVATYTCNPGYTPQGSDQRTCQQDGTWSGVEPVCILIDICPQLTDPANGEVVVSGLTAGSQATYSCRAGYELIGSERRECQISGVWTGSDPFCRLTDCGDLTPPTFGAVDVRRTTFGAMAFYSCDAGYFLQGVSKRTCQSDGQWSNEAPTCQLLDCGSLLPPENGKVMLTTTTFLSVASYSCNERHVLVGNTVRICLITAQWSGSMPECRLVEVQCPVLENPENGAVTTTGQKPGDTASYVCSQGYILDGSNTRRCQESGLWSGDAPTCKPVDCGPLPDPDNGRVTVFETTLGSPAVYSCNPGFQLVGEARRICTDSGKWSDKEPACSPVVCPALSNPANGVVSVIDLTFNSVATYTCNSGYVISGVRQRTCLETGEWSGQEPSCIRPQPGCGDPGVPSNGRRIGDSFSVESVVFFRCFDDYDIIGSKYRVCQADGTWSGTQPTCRRFDDSCTSDKDNIDRNGRRCQCVDGKLIKCCRVRRDYVGLTEEERQIYINTFLAVTRDPIYRARYDTLVKLYKDSFTVNNVTQSGVATESQYFMFSRYFLLEYEDILRDFNSNITIPFYDWTPFPVAPYTAAVWDNTYGFGNSARTTDKCVISGPVRVGEYAVAPSAGGGCLQRDYMNRRFPSREIINRDVLTFPASEFDNFHQMLQLLVGLNVQCFIGGTMCSTDAANDPVFLLHLAQLDSLLTRWQLFGDGRDQVRYAFDNQPLLLTPGFTVAQFSSNINLPYDLCILYDPPVLLKNHGASAPALAAAPPTRFGFSLEAVALPQERRMDCVPEDMMGHMDKFMDEGNHQFMKKECEKRQPIS